LHSWSYAVIAFEYAEIGQEQAESGKPYLQFINEGTMSLGLYVLAAGSADTQSPHDEDEIYYVVAGRGAIVVAGERRPVQPGSIVFVAKEVEHRFVDIDEDLSILVFFAPQHEPQ
jgi:mannose-6-phosphate isomerase-like protein (cupin superfamily)